jgi:hypothetical protein
MKVAVFGESDLDETAIRILIEAILGKQTHAIDFRPRARGWPAICNDLPAVLKRLHYHTDAEAAVIVADSDDSPLHQTAHEQSGKGESECRLCSLREKTELTFSQLNPISGRAMIRTAIGIAVPAIEAWYLCGTDPRASEAPWLQGGQSMRGARFRKELKRTLYGKDLVPSQLKQQRLKEEALRLAQDLDMLEKFFPIGFGSLARSVRNW